MRRNDTKRDNHLKEEVHSLGKMNVLVFWESLSWEPVTMCRKAEECEKWQGVNFQCGNNAAGKTGNLTSRCQKDLGTHWGLWEFASALDSCSTEAKPGKKGWQWDRRTWSVLCLRLIFLLKLKAENISPSDIFPSSTCSSTVLPSSMFRLWACSQGPQPGKLIENDSSAGRRSLFVLCRSSQNTFVLVFSLVLSLWWCNSCSNV